MTFGYIYRTICLPTGRSYVGQHRGAFTPRYIGSGKLIRRSIAKHGRDQFTVEPLAFAESQQELNKLEMRNIIEHRALGVDLYNISIGGEGAGSGPAHYLFGKRHSEETRKKMSAVHKGRPKTPEMRKKLSAAVSGKNNPQFGKRGTFTGHHHSEEAKRAHSIRMKALCAARVEGAR